MLINRKTIFDILKEADGDEEQSATADNDTNQTQDESPSPEESGEDAGEDDYGDDGDFDIDTNLDDDGGDGDTGSEDTGDETGSMDTGGGDSAGGEDEEPPVEANTDIFATLSEEEQKVKILELKKMFVNLYTSTDDILERINSTETNNLNIDIMDRVSMTLYSLRDYINDYITTSFARKSYIENDITFNRFLSILNGISIVISELGKIKMQNEVKPEKK